MINKINSKKDAHHELIGILGIGLFLIIHI
jgi:hypothetical protein